MKNKSMLFCMLMMLFGITAFASGDASARSLKNKMNAVMVNIST